MQQWRGGVASSPQLEPDQLLLGPSSLQPPMDFMRNVSLKTVLCYMMPYGLVDRYVGLLNAISACIMLLNLAKSIELKIHKIVILPVVLYGCVTWSLTLRKEHRTKVFENKVQGGICGAMMGVQ
jgi:hypothetical protein